MGCEGRCEGRIRREVLWCSLAVCIPIIFLLASIGDDVEEVKELNKGACRLGEFPCGGNTSMCLPREKWCDFHPDCPNQEDESEASCQDHKSTFVATSFFVVCPASMGDLTAEMFNSCDLGATYPSQCKCSKGTEINCRELGLSQIPDGIPSNITSLVLSNNAIKDLRSEHLQSFRGLGSLHLAGNQISHLEPGTFINLTKLAKLYLGENNLTEILPDTFEGLRSVLWLVLEQNQIRTIHPGAFNGLESLCMLRLTYNAIHLPAYQPFPLLSSFDGFLDLSHNDIDFISNQTFHHLTQAKVILLQHNRISEIEPDAFVNNFELQDLNMQGNQITHIEPALFSRSPGLQALSLADNPITEFELHTFDGLVGLNSLNLTGLIFDERMKFDIFLAMGNLSFIYFSSFELCQFAPQVRSCYPKGDGISSIADLLGSEVLRICVWIIGITTCTANLLVLAVRMTFYEERNVPAVFIKNLAVSDFFMGVYLINVGAHDVLYRNYYNRYAFMWMKSWDCQTGGILAMLSCEASILILTAMSLERYLVVAFPYQWKGMTLRAAVCLMAAIWVIGIMLAVTPLIPADSLYSFYSSNGVCFPLHIHEPYMTGWQYSAMVFIGINGVAFVIMVVCYAGMFCSIRHSQKVSGRKIDMAISKRLFLLVFTDALCWIPIIAIKTLAFANIGITDEFYAWLAIFVLPVNSSLNPILYSIATPAFKRNLNEHMPERLTSISLTLKRGTSLSTENGHRTSLSDKH